MNIIGITGRKRSGKDSLAKFFQEYSNERWEIVSFAGALRTIMYEVCYVPLGYDYESDKEKEVLRLKEDELTFVQPMTVKMLSYNNDTLSHNLLIFKAFLWYEFKGRTFSPREFLQKLGTEFGREQLGPNIWVDMLINSLDSRKNYIIPDVRFNNEAESIKASGGILVKTIRPDLDMTDEHASEQGVSLHYVNHVIIADNLEELRIKGKIFMDYHFPNKHKASCLGCYECSDGDENLQSYD